MPTLPAAGNVIKLQLHKFLGNDANCYVHLYYAYTGGPPAAADLNGWCGVVGGAWNTDLAALHGSDVELVGVIATDLSSVNGARGTTTRSDFGTRAGGVLPASTCLVQNMLVSRRYRGGKPRIYWPAGTDSDLASAQSWSTGFRSAFNTAFNAFETLIEATPPTGLTITGKVNVSYYHGFTVVTNPTTGRARNRPNLRATPVVDTVYNYTLNPIPGSQRRRLRP